MLTINFKKLEIAKARACMGTRELAKAAGMSEAGLMQIQAKKSRCRPATVGKLCKALNCDPLDIIDDKEE